MGDPDFGFIEKYVSQGLTVGEHPIGPGVLAAPIHTHSREDELSYVVHGTIQAQIGDRVITAGPHDVIWKPRGIPHGFWNPGPERALVLELVMPGGLEKYFVELFDEFRKSAGGPPDPASMAAIQARYGLEMDMASIPALLERYRLRPPRI